jgi:hypothetical protein
MAIAGVTSQASLNKERGKWGVLGFLVWEGAI